MPYLKILEHLADIVGLTEAIASFFNAYIEHDENLKRERAQKQGYADRIKFLSGGEDRIARNTAAFELAGKENFHSMESLLQNLDDARRSNSDNFTALKKEFGLADDDLAGINDGLGLFELLLAKSAGNREKLLAILSSKDLLDTSSGNFRMVLADEKRWANESLDETEAKVIFEKKIWPDIEAKRKKDLEEDLVKNKQAQAEFNEYLKTSKVPPPRPH